MADLAELPAKFFSAGFRQESQGEGKDLVFETVLMMVWLGRQEAVTRFQAYLVYTAKQTNTSTQDSQQLDSDSEDLDNDDLNDTSVPILMSVKPAYPHVGISTITTEFKATGFIHALTTYI